MSAAEDAEWLRWVTKQFGSIAGEDKEINLEEFKTALQVKEVNAPRGVWGAGVWGPFLQAALATRHRTVLSYCIWKKLSLKIESHGVV